MLEIGQTLKIFAPGEGTYTIEVVAVSPPITCYMVKAKDYKGGFYEYINEFKWRGPKNVIYYVLDENNQIIDPKCNYMKEAK